jgi:Dolichyl-phosphate-mannose-protein mannosyltransferase
MTDILIKADEARRSESKSRGLLVVLLVVTAYVLLHAGFRLLASHVLGEDDVVDIVLTQDLRAGYEAFPRQPPLYDWVLWAVQHVTGPRFENFLAIKYAALVASAGFLYLSALRALGDRLFALLTVESLALIYSISWRYHEGFTHEVGAMVAVLATTWLMLKVLQEGRTTDYVGLAIAMGLGFLTEPAYSVFLATLFVAVALQPAMRPALLQPQMFMALLSAVVIASPYLLWLLEDARRTVWLSGLWDDGWSFNAGGMWDAVRGPIAYLSPLIFILPLIFPGWLRTALGDLRRWAPPDDEPDYELLFRHIAALCLVASIAGALLFEIQGLAVHVLMPLYLTTVIWLFGVARRSGYQPLHVRRFGQIAIVIAVVAFLARMANLFIMEPACHKCRWGVPYDTLAQEMKDRGFTADGTIVSLYRDISGNLRPLFPNADVITRRYPEFTPEGADWTRGRVAYVWDGSMEPHTAQRFLRFLLPKGIEAWDAELVRVPWRSLWKETGYRTSSWYLLIVDKGGQKRIVNNGSRHRVGK